MGKSTVKHIKLRGLTAEIVCDFNDDHKMEPMTK